MKFVLTLLIAGLSTLTNFAQVGIGTVSPNSTLDIRGSLSINYRSFSGATSLSSNDHTVVFTGSSATTATLPDASTCPGRTYCIKNFSAGPPAALTIATVSSQKIDGAASWILDEPNETINVGSDGANWEVFGLSVPSSGGNPWDQGGNSISATRSLGTISNFDLPFVTNNSERMRITSAGNVGIGTPIPSYKLQVTAAANPLYLAGVQTGLNTDSILTIVNGVVRKLQPGALVVSSSNAWALVGNAGTNPASNFLGTTDAQAFILKENNSQVGRFEATSIALGSGATTANSTNCYALGSGANIGFNKVSAVAIGTNAGVSNDSSFAIGTAAATSGQNAFSIGSGSQANSINSLAIGRNAYVGYSIIDGVAIGTNATTGGANAISIGSNTTAAGKTQATAASSIAMGNAAAANSANGIAIGTGAAVGYSLTNPVAIGDGAIVNGSNGLAVGNGANVSFVSNATALGAGASVTSTGNNSTALGYNSSATQTNEIILGDRSNNSLSVGIGTESFSGSNREKLLVDAGTTSSVNAIVGRGTNPSYLQLNIQNLSNGAGASSDVVATADNGNETTNFVDMGVNSSTNTSGVMGAANDAYLYTTGNNFLLGTGTAAKAMVFLTGGTSQAANERMRIDGSGNLGIGTNAPNQKLHVNGNINLTGAFMPGNAAGNAGDYLVSTGAGTAPVWFNAAPYIGTVAWSLGGNNVASLQKFGTTSNFDLPVLTNNIERMRITNTGNVAIDPPTGVATFNATNPEKLLVDAGVTSSVNAIVGKGTSTTYLQLNIQNLSNGNGASSDVVATADNGSETVNYVDMGMNSSTNSSGVMGAANDAYLYTTGNNFLIGTGTAAKALVFMTGGTAQATNERMRIDGSGNVGISTTSPSSTLQVRGSVGMSITTKTANATVAAIDYTTLCNNTTGPITITLPTAVGVGGRVYIIKKISGAGNNVTVACFGAETIDGNPTSVITAQYGSIMIQSDSINWYILSNNN